MLGLLEEHVLVEVLLAIFLLCVRTELHFKFLFFLLSLRMHGLCSVAARELIKI